MGSYWREASNITNYNEKTAIDRSYSEEGGINPLTETESFGLESAGSQKERKTEANLGKMRQNVERG